MANSDTQYLKVQEEPPFERVILTRSFPCQNTSDITVFSYKSPVESLLLPNVQTYHYSMIM